MEQEITKELPTEEEPIAEDPLYGNEMAMDYDIPITRQTELDNKILSSYNKRKKISIVKPVIEHIRVGIPLVDENKQVVLVKGVPVLDKIKKIPVLKSFEREDVDFPIPEWFNDSTTSSFLTKSEARFLNKLDDLGITLFVKSMYDEKKDYTGFLNRLFWIKASIVDASKGRDGIAAERAKSQFTRSESVARVYQDKVREIEEIKKGGLYNWIIGKK